MGIPAFDASEFHNTIQFIAWERDCVQLLKQQMQFLVMDPREYLFKSIVELLYMSWTRSSEKSEKKKKKWKKQVRFQYNSANFTYRWNFVFQCQIRCRVFETFPFSIWRWPPLPIQNKATTRFLLWYIANIYCLAVKAYAKSLSLCREKVSIMLWLHEALSNLLGRCHCPWQGCWIRRSLPT